MSICTDVGSFIESKMSVVQTSNVGFTSEVPDYLVVHTGPDQHHAAPHSCTQILWMRSDHLRNVTWVRTTTITTTMTIIMMLIIMI